MRKKTNVLILLSIFFLIIIGCTYAYSRYSGAAFLETKVKSAAWNIKVNECSIVDPDSNPEAIKNDCFETKTIPVEGEENQIVEIVKNFRVTEEYITYFPLENEEVVGDNKIAPGTEARFNIKIDPYMTEAAFKYTLKASHSAPNIKFYIIECNMEEKDGKETFVPIKNESGEETPIPLSTDGYVNYIYYSENIAERIQYIQVKVVWENDETGDSDKTDTQIGTADTQPILSIPVSIEFEQITSQADTTPTSEPTTTEAEPIVS